MDTWRVRVGCKAWRVRVGCKAEAFRLRLASRRECFGPTDAR